MPSFLSKVFGRKHKDDEPAPGRPSDGSLLEGKFEAVSPTVSPTANTFAESYARDKENGRFSLFRLRSHPSRTVTSQSRAESNVPHLSLNIPGRKDGATSPSPVLGVAFEANLDSHVTLSDAEIGERMLNTAETLKLVRACSQSIIARGVFCIASYTVFSADLVNFRPGDTWSHAPALVFSISRYPTETYFIVHKIFGF
jgi:hypothetical protein